MVDSMEIKTIYPYMTREETKSEAGVTKFLIKDDIIEITGSEEFVSKQVEFFKDSINARLINQISKVPEKAVDKSRILYLNPAQQPTGEIIEYVAKNEAEDGKPRLDYDNVFVITNNEVTIIADVPGDNTSQRMINLIVLYLFAKLKLGTEEVSFRELREVCEKYGEIDKTNFSRIIQNNKRLFLITGDGKSLAAKLIRPGIKVAEKLIMDLNSKNQ